LCLISLILVRSALLIIRQIEDPCADATKMSVYSVLRAVGRDVLAFLARDARVLHACRRAEQVEGESLFHFRILGGSGFRAIMFMDDHALIGIKRTATAGV